MAVGHLGSLLPDPLHNRVNIRDYAQKLAQHGQIALVVGEQKIVGILAMYANDFETKIAFISLVAISEEYQSQGIGRILLEQAKNRALKAGMRELSLRVHRSNIRAIKFYRTHGFKQQAGPENKLNMTMSILPNTSTQIYAL